MTKETYDLINKELNSLDWSDYAYNFNLLMLDVKERYNLTEDDLLDFEGFSKCETENKIEEGFLKGYDCPICRNRGYMNFHEVKNGNIYYYVKNCECMKIRNMYTQLEKCGIHKNQLDKYTFENYIAKYDWQVAAKNKAKSYLEDCNNFWFVISGQSGCGKSHLCTAIYRGLIEKGHKVKYMVWKDDLSRLKMNKRSSYSESQKSYAREINELKTVEILYIDDFLKLISNVDYERDLELEIAFNILNSRYANGLKTIISSEKFIWEINEMDEAVAGRIKEMANEYLVQIRADESKNIRFVGGINGTNNI